MRSTAQLDGVNQRWAYWQVTSQPQEVPANISSLPILPPRCKPRANREAADLLLEPRDKVIASLPVSEQEGRRRLSERNSRVVRLMVATAFVPPNLPQFAGRLSQTVASAARWRVFREDCGLTKRLTIFRDHCSRVAAHQLVGGAILDAFLGGGTRPRLPLERPACRDTIVVQSDSRAAHRHRGVR